jgi:hypothetical protein
MLANTELVDRIKAGRADPSRLVKRDRFEEVDEGG